MLHKALKRKRKEKINIKNGNYTKIIIKDLIIYCLRRRTIQFLYFNM